MLSVIVCTFNRADKLHRCLESIFKADVPVEGLEVIVVDNNSNDHTGNVVQQWSTRFRVPFYYVFEPKRGLSTARNRGVRQSQGEILAFTDDDCVASPTWCQRIVATFTTDERLMILGGKVMPLESQDRVAAIRLFHDAKHILSFSEILERMIGCNMAVKRDAMKRLGGFDTRLGAGTPVGSAEDLDFLYRALKAKMRVFYSPDCFVWHGHGRTSDASLQEIRANYIMGRGAFYVKHMLKGDPIIFKNFAWETISLLKRAMKGDLQIARLKPIAHLYRGAISRLLSDSGEMPAKLVQRLKPRAHT